MPKRVTSSDAGFRNKPGKASDFVQRRRAVRALVRLRYSSSYASPFVPASSLALPELKTIDSGSLSKECGTTGSITLINGIAQGNDYTDRIGRVFRNKSIQIQGFIGPNDLVSTFGKWRIMVVYDCHSNGATIPVMTDILTVSSASSFMNLTNRSRFKVLYDETGVISYQDYSGTGGLSAFVGTPNVFDINVYKEINLKTICQGTTAAQASYNVGAIYLVTIGTAADNVSPAFVGRTRIRFIDS